MINLEKKVQELKDAGETVYSYSRLGTFNNCLYEAYLTYVKKETGKDNIYCCLGGQTHQVLEDIVNGKATEADLLPAINMELEEAESLGITFPKDRNGGDTMRENWVKNMFHFAQTYKSPRGKNLKTEEMFLYKSPHGKYLQGFIDLQHIHPDDSVSIYDYKTSSLFTKENIQEHNRQLIIYSLALMQQGIKVRKTAFIMLKYVDVTYTWKKTSRSKDKTEIKKTIERRKIGQELSGVIEGMLQEKGYDDIDIEMMVADVQRSNLLTRLPREIQKQFKIRPCLVECDLSEENIKECEEYIDNTIEMWEKLDKTSAKDFTPLSFTKINSAGKTVSNVFYCTSLCQHFEACGYIHDFLEMEGIKKQQEKEDEELFS